MSTPTTINEWTAHVHKVALDHGFWDDDVWLISLAKTPEEITKLLSYVGNRKIALINTESAEMTEWFRGVEGSPLIHADDYRAAGSIPIALNEEIADAIIRCMDLAAFFQIDLEAAIRAKSAKNEARPYKHGKSF